MKVRIYVADGPGEDALIEIDGVVITDRVQSWSASGDRGTQQVSFDLVPSEIEIVMDPDYRPVQPGRQ